MDVPDQGAENLSVSREGLRRHEIDDMLCEVRVEFAVLIIGSCGAVGAVRSHDEIFFPLNTDRNIYRRFLSKKRSLADLYMANTLLGLKMFSRINGEQQDGGR